MNNEIKFTVLGHACLYIEYKSIKLLIDPWLYGSCYWRSWWNYPKIKQNTLENIKPTHIYITHLHWDHFHGPSLRKFEKFQPKIMLPFSCTKRMLNDMERDFKFKQIVELRHSKKYTLEENFEITSYQFNPVIIDSSLILNIDGLKIFNANDVKVFGKSLDQIIKIHKNFDFVFRSHSSATQIPFCFEDFHNFEFKRTQEDYSKEFFYFSKKVKAKYTIPFASSHIYLHRNSFEYNHYYNSPKLVKDNLERNVIKNPECVLMPSGSSWSSEKGFDLFNHDYTKINEHINDYKEENKFKLEKFYKIEESTKVNSRAFENYFSKFFSALKFIPTNFRLGFFITPFNENKDNGKLAIVDFKKRYTEYYKNYSLKNETLCKERLDFLITISPKVFNDCNTKFMYNCWGPSKLMKIYLGKSNSSSKYRLFCNLIDFYENDGLPIWRILSPRHFSNRLIRWREVIDMFIYFYVLKFKKKQIYHLWK